MARVCLPPPQGAAVTGDTFPSELDDWMPADWADYRRRIGSGEPTTSAMDAVTARRRREAQQTPATEVTR